MKLKYRDVLRACWSQQTYRKINAAAQSIADRTGGDVDMITDWIMFHRVCWNGPASIEQLAAEWRVQTPTPIIDAIMLKFAALDAEERAGRQAAQDEAAWSRYGY